MSSDAIVCRCEDVLLSDIRRLLDSGLTTFDEIKKFSRCGMGPCQGRTCRPLVLAEIARYRGIRVQDLEPGRFRPPAKSIPISAFLEGGEGP